MSPTAQVVITPDGAGYAFTAVRDGYLVAQGWLDAGSIADAHAAIEALLFTLGYNTRVVTS